MNAFERDRLARVSEDAERWLLEIKRMLTYPETVEQDAAAIMARAALELAKGIRKLLERDKEKAASAGTETADHQPDGQ